MPPLPGSAQGRTFHVRGRTFQFSRLHLPILGASGGGTHDVLYRVQRLPASSSHRAAIATSGEGLPSYQRQPVNLRLSFNSTPCRDTCPALSELPLSALPLIGMVVDVRVTTPVYSPPPFSVLSSPLDALHKPHPAREFEALVLIAIY